MAKGSGGGGRSGRGAGLDSGATGARRAQLETRRSANVEQDKKLYIERRSATPERRAQIDVLRGKLENQRFVIDFGIQRARQLGIR